MKYHRPLIGFPRTKKCIGSVRLIEFAELVRAWGRGRELALPCKVEYLSDVLQPSVQIGMKPKVKGGIDVESSVKGKRWSCQSPFSREPAYITLRIRERDADLSRDMKKDVGRQR